jgi:UDP-glucose 4-epimerase
VRRFVYAGSSSVYGDQPELPKRESMAPRPKSPYALTKLAGEIYCTQYYELFGLATVTLRYFNVFGPRQNPDSLYAAVIPLFIRAALTGESPHVHGDGGQTRDFTYIDNVVEANLLALEADPARVGGAVLNIACGDRTSLLDLLTILSRLAERPVTPVFEAARAGDVRDSQAAVEEAEQRLGFRPVVDLEEGLRRTMAWTRARLAL